MSDFQRYVHEGKPKKGVQHVKVQLEPGVFYKGADGKDLVVPIGEAIDMQQRGCFRPEVVAAERAAKQPAEPGGEL